MSNHAIALSIRSSVVLLDQSGQGLFRVLASRQGGLRVPLTGGIEVPLVSKRYPRPSIGRRSRLCGLQYQDSAPSRSPLLIQDCSYICLSCLAAALGTFRYQRSAPSRSSSCDIRRPSSTMAARFRRPGGFHEPGFGSLQITRNPKLGPDLSPSLPGLQVHRLAQLPFAIGNAHNTIDGDSECGSRNPRSFRNPPVPLDCG